MRKRSVGALDKRVAIWKREFVDDGMARVFGDPVFVDKRWAQKSDISDRERMKAGEHGQELTTRWTVHDDSITRTITGGFYLVHQDKVYEVTGVKDSASRRHAVEITTIARPDAIMPEPSTSDPDTGTNDEG